MVGDPSATGTEPGSILGSLTEGVASVFLAASLRGQGRTQLPQTRKATLQLWPRSARAVGKDTLASSAGSEGRSVPGARGRTAYGQSGGCRQPGGWGGAPVWGPAALGALPPLTETWLLPETSARAAEGAEGHVAIPRERHSGFPLGAFRGHFTRSPCPAPQLGWSIGGFS